MPKGVGYPKGSSFGGKKARKGKKKGGKKGGGYGSSMSGSGGCAKNTAG